MMTACTRSCYCLTGVYVAQTGTIMLMLPDLLIFLITIGSVMLCFGMIYNITCGYRIGVGAVRLYCQ